MLRYPYCNRRRCQKMQQETNTSIEILVELAIADAVFETGGDKHTSYRFRPPAVENLLLTMSQAVNKHYGCCFLSTQCSLSHTHTGCCCDFVAVLNDRDLSGVVVMPTGRVKYGLCH